MPEERQSIDKQNEKTAMRVSTVSIAVNLLLSAGKLLAGIFGRSGAMISDAVHSASDVFSTFIVIAGIRISAKKSDVNHPYGHERMECVASIILATVLMATGFGIGLGGLRTILSGKWESLAVPGVTALAAAIVSIAGKEWMYWYTRAAAKKINSGALMADAWHHRSDSLSSVGALIGIAGSRMGYPVLDPAASIVISAFIAKAAYEIFMDAVNKMVDKACAPETEDTIRRIVLEQEGVLGIDRLMTRLFGAKIYVDMEIAADGSRTLYETHGIAEQVHDAIEAHFPEVKHCMVHVNPADPGSDRKQ
ncbi:MAG: cation transporter [Lachnospiraceae bacterium]|nr:cation transporter [Lachnospiraceae bacterium]MCI9657452.1 cation transporter [Lachnospiraceae bacterium]